MATDSAELLLHPIRLRIVLAMTGTGMTTTELRQRLPDVAPATLYRHVAILVGSGLLEVVGEKQKRGTVERTYRVVEAQASLGAEDAASMTREEHLSAFITFVGALIQSFGRYLDQPEADFGRDGVGYRQAGLWVTPSELKKLVGDLGKVLAPYLKNEPRRGRSRVLLNTILVPDGNGGGTNSASSR